MRFLRSLALILVILAVFLSSCSALDLPDTGDTTPESNTGETASGSQITVLPSPEETGKPEGTTAQGTDSAKGTTQPTTQNKPSTGDAVTTKEPSVTTQAPAVTTQAPAVTTQAPAVTTQAPAVTTQAPAVTTQAPAVTTQAPAVTTQAPAVTTQVPAVTTQVPVTTAPQIPNPDPDVTTSGGIRVEEDTDDRNWGDVFLPE